VVVVTLGVVAPVLPQLAVLWAHLQVAGQWQQWRLELLRRVVVVWVAVAVVQQSLRALQRML
jgi:hypothetical protein